MELGDRQKPLIIDFYATWCGPCVLLAKELEQARTCRPLLLAAVLTACEHCAQSRVKARTLPG